MSALNSSGTVPEPIAIVGMGCRFPGADGPRAFWELIHNGVDAVGDMPGGRFDVEAFYDPTPGTRGRIVTRQGGFLPDVDRFDAAFFGISPREAGCIDPQQRLLLEVAWEAIEDAGLTRTRLAGSLTGVFVGMWTNEYEARMFAQSPDIDLYVTTGGGRYAASGRLSYALDLRGPSLTLDTACSSSLVAIHLACQSLCSGESEMALAGGVNLILEPHITIGYSRSSMLSADGRCRFGDASASGYVRSEGVGVIVLKPLARALADGDPIHALIRGSAVNNDGRGSEVLVAPSPLAQAAMLRQAYRAAGIVPGHVGYVEAHGTGTRIGDPVELRALGEVLAEGRAPRQRCRVGSIKTNIGHAEAASGIAGLIKAVLCLQHRLIPASLHLHEPNPRIPWDGLPLLIPRTPEPWPADFTPAYAGVNSFGVTGTNAHVVLQEAPATARPAPAHDDVDGRARMVPLSAKSPDALRAMAERWMPLLAGETASTASLDDLCYTAGVRRTHHEHRLVVVGAKRAEMADRLRAWLDGQTPGGVSSGTAAAQRPRVAFVFPGQGSQWLGMGRKLLETAPAFRGALERCEAALAPHVDWSLLGELMAEPARSQLERIDVVQPTLFAIQVALATLWRAWGVEPDAVVGHSMGEVAAAHVAGALSLDDAARVIAGRSRLLRRIAGRGAMAMVELSVEQARAALTGHEDRLSVAVCNGSRSTVLSGDVPALDALLDQLEHRGVFCRRVKVDVASHSPHVDPLRADLIAALHGIAPGSASTPLVSTVTGEHAEGPMLGAEYWARNLREPVLFGTALGRLIASGIDAFIEMSPHPVLLAPVQEALMHAGLEGDALGSGRRDEDEQAAMLESLGALWTRGYPLDWTRRFPEATRVVSLPAYPWQRERFWYDDGRPSAFGLTSAQYPLLGTHVALASEPGAHVWAGRIELVAYPCLAELGDTRAEFSAAACLEAVRAAAGRIGRKVRVLDDVAFPEAMRLAAPGAALQLEIRPEPSGALRFRALGQASETAEWTTLAAGSIVDSTAGADAPGAADVVAIRARTREIPLDALQSWCRSGHPPTIAGLWLGRAEGIARLHGPDGESCPLHPPALETAFHVLASIFSADPERAVDWRPRAIRRLLLGDTTANVAWVHARAGARTSGGATGDVWLLDGAGRPVLELQGVRLTPPPPTPVAQMVHRIEWTPRARDERTAPPAPGRWILVGPALDRIGALSGRLRAEGYEVVTVDAFAGADALARSLDAALAPNGLPCTGVVHIGSLAIDPATSPLGDRVATGSWRSALATVQALARRPDGMTTPRLWLVTCGAQVATADEAAGSLGGAALWGFGGVVAHEYPALQCARVDLPLTWSAADLLQLGDELLGADDEDAVALRGDERRVARLVAGATAPASAAVPVRGDRIYLISGGLGGLGLAVARWLAARGALHLALFGRRAPSDEAQRTIGELRSAGVEVVVRRGDVACADDVRRILDELPSGVPLGGVVHAAGVFEGGILADLEAESFASVMRPKIEGALNLHAATRDRALDFFTVFSSVSAVLGFPGVATYAAANAALDALIARRRHDGHAGLSIAWGPWSDVGLIAARAEGGRQLATDGLDSLTPEEGMRAMEHVLGTDMGHVLVTRLAVERWARAYPSGARSLLRDGRSRPVAGNDSEGARTRLRGLPPAAQQGAIESWLSQQVGQVLRTTTVSLTDPLKAMGLDSLLSLELRNRLEKALGIGLPVTAIWNYPTVSALAAHLNERLYPEVSCTTTAATVADTDRVEQLLEEVENLSDHDVQRLLNETGSR